MFVINLDKTLTNIGITNIGYLFNTKHRVCLNNLRNFRRDVDEISALLGYYAALDFLSLEHVPL